MLLERFGARNATSVEETQHIVLLSKDEQFAVVQARSIVKRKKARQSVGLITTLIGGLKGLLFREKLTTNQKKAKQLEGIDTCESVTG